MKAKETERVQALRLIVSELQRAAKDGNADEVAILQTARKKRLEAAKAFRDGGRDDAAKQEESEAALIEGVAGGPLDPSAPEKEVVSLMGLDATRPFGKDFPEVCRVPGADEFTID